MGFKTSREKRRSDDYYKYIMNKKDPEDMHDSQHQQRCIISSCSDLAFRQFLGDIFECCFGAISI